jgi:hypothetical protein
MKGARGIMMNTLKSRILVAPLPGDGSRAYLGSTHLIYFALAIALVWLASPAMVLGAGPEGLNAAAFGESAGLDRLAAMARFYTDRHERAAYSDSADYRAMAAYFVRVPFSSVFGSSASPARMAAVARFYTDRYERASSTASSEYVALARALGSTENAVASSISSAASADSARLAAVVRYYTDRHERMSYADSALYRAVAVYLNQVLFAGDFGGLNDPDRRAAVVRFYTDPYERAASASSAQSVALTNALNGVGTGVQAEWLACSESGSPMLVCSAETAAARP